MQKIFKWLTPLIFVGVSAFVFFFMTSLYKDEPIDVALANERHSKVPTTTQTKSWLDGFAKVKSEDYYYPTNELLFRFDFEQNAVLGKNLYRLLANIADPYELFCLEEVIKRTNLHYMLNKIDNTIELLIFSDDKSKLDELVSQLRQYDIKATVEPNNKES